jgi:hypothetical protein
VPVVSINTNFKDLLVGGAVKGRKFKDLVALALTNYNLIEGGDTFALYFNDINIRVNFSWFAKALENALPNTFANNKPIIIILGFDGAKMLGLTIKKETALRGNLFCLDELFLEPGDWIDIGQPLGESQGQAFPITIKSLIFNQNKQKIAAQARLGGEQSSPSDKISSNSTVKTPLKPNTQTSSVTTTLSSPARLDPVRISQLFKQFQSEHKGYEVLLIFTPKGDLEFTSDEGFLSPKDVQNLYKAWQEHEPAFFIGEDRFPILSWAELQFAASNIKGKGIVVGTKTKTNRFVVMKVDPGTKWEPNIANYAVKMLNQWSWDLI